VIVVKKVIFALLQFVLFFVAYVVGTFLPPFGLLPPHVQVWASGTTFEWDGFLLAIALFVVILLIEAFRKRLRTAAPWTTLAFALAAIIAFAAKLGITTPDR
jgi:hypothetical protein